MAGLEDQDYGKITIGRPSCEAKIGSIFQSCRESLYPWRTCLDNLVVPLELNGVPRRVEAQVGVMARTLWARQG